MKKWIYPVFLWIALFAACSSPSQLQSTPAIQITPLPSITTTSTPKPTSIPTVDRATNTTSPPSPSLIDTITPSPAFPPEGVFAIKFYPPLVLDYPAEQWLDQSEYDNTQMMVNYLQHRKMKTCTIGPMGASGFYPGNMDEIMLGSMGYQVLLDQQTTDGKVASYYFAKIENEAGIPHFAVQYIPEEAEECRSAAEAVLATIRSPDQPKSY